MAMFVPRSGISACRDAPNSDSYPLDLEHSISRTVTLHATHEWHEASQDVFRRANDRIQLLNYWLARRWAPLRERYEEGTAALHVHMSVVVGDSDAREFCLVCEQPSIPLFYDG